MLKPFVILYLWYNKSLVCLDVLKDHLMHILSTALTSLHILPNSEFSVFEGMIEDTKGKVNVLVQQASGFDVGGRNFHIKERPMQENFVVVDTCGGTQRQNPQAHRYRSSFHPEYYLVLYP